MTTKIMPIFENLGSLITFKSEDGRDQCLGFLFASPQHGVFDPDLGKVDISPEHVKAHNKALSKALIEGLDNCQVGQCGCFYAIKKDDRWKVTTFIGDEVHPGARVNGNIITFGRHGKVFRGRLRKDCDLFSFRRIK